MQVARAAIISPTRALVDVHFERDERLRSLRVRHVVCPISSVRRIAKYTAKGYRCNTVEVVKLFAEWSTRAEAEEKAEEKPPPPAPERGEPEVGPTRILELYGQHLPVPATGGGQSEAARSQIDDALMDALVTGLYVD